MEILIVIVVALVLAAVFGAPLQIILYIALGLVELSCVLSLLLFWVSLCLLPFSKKVDASYLDVEKADHGMYYAFYLADGQQYRCLFPTDAFLKKILYRKVDTNVRLIKIKYWARVIDRCTIVTISLGLVLFSMIGVFVGLVLLIL